MRINYSLLKDDFFQCIYLSFRLMVCVHSFACFIKERQTEGSVGYAGQDEIEGTAFARDIFTFNTHLAVQFFDDSLDN